MTKRLELTRPGARRLPKIPGSSLHNALEHASAYCAASSTTFFAGREPSRAVASGASFKALLRPESHSATAKKKERNGNIFHLRLNLDSGEKTLTSRSEKSDRRCEDVSGTKGRGRRVCRAARLRMTHGGFGCRPVSGFWEAAWRSPARPLPRAER